MTDVLHVTPMLFGAGGYWGGGERYPVELVRAQSSLVDARLVTVGSERRRWREDGLDVTVLPARTHWKGNDLNGLSEQMLGLIARSRVVHVHQYNTALTSLCLMAGAALRKPVYVTDHGASAPHLNAQLRLHHLVRSHLAVSNYATRFFPQLSRRTKVIYAGVDTNRFAPPPAGTPRTRRVVYVGRVMPHKGLDVLIRAVDADTPLHIYGRSYDDRYLDHLHELAAGKAVTFRHDASDEEVVAAMQDARVAVLPSVYRTYEGESAPKAEYFGMVLAEAMACGTPVVGTEVGGIPEVVEHGKTGLVVAPSDVDALRDALVQILDALAGQWEAWSQACLEHVAANFTWRRVAERCLAAYGQS